MLASRERSTGLDKWIKGNEGRDVIPSWMLEADGTLRHLPLPLPAASQRLRPKRLADKVNSKPAWRVVRGDE